MSGPSQIEGIHEDNEFLVLKLMTKLDQFKRNFYVLLNENKKLSKSVSELMNKNELQRKNVEHAQSLERFYEDLALENSKIKAENCRLKQYKCPEDQHQIFIADLDDIIRTLEYIIEDLEKINGDD